jgi:hypothetical protein
VNKHIDELAELYALGTLDEAQRAAVDAHALECDECAMRLGEAASTIAFMEQSAAVPSSLDRRMSAVFHRPQPFHVSSALVAAAFIIGLLPSLWLWNGLRTSQAFNADREQAVQAMVSSHFLHAQFVALTPGAPKAKLIYARSGSWIFAVAQSGRPLSLRARTASGETAVGVLHVQGNAGELFVPNAPRVRVFSLFDGGREIERVTLPSH